MAIAFVRELANAVRTATGVSTITLTPTANAGAGNLVILAANAAAGRTVTSVTDTQSNTWTIGPDPGDTGSNDQVAYTQQDGGSLTTSDAITVTFSGTGVNKVALALEFSGVKTSSPLDQSGTVVGGTLSPSVPTASSIAQGNELVVGSFAWSSHGSSQQTYVDGLAGPGQPQYFSYEQDENTGGYLGVTLGYAILDSTGSGVQTYGGAIQGTVAPGSLSGTILTFLPQSNDATIPAPPIGITDADAAEGLTLSISGSGIQFIQNVGSAVSTSTGASTLRITPTANCGAAHLLVLASNCPNQKVIASVTDTQSNTWTVGPSPGSSNTTGAQALTAWTLQDSGALTPADTVTVTYTGTGSNKLGIILEFSGVRSTPIDVENTGVDGTASPSVGTGSAITNAGDLLVGVFAWSSNTPQRTFTPGSGYTEFEVDELSGGFLGLSVEYQILSGASLTTYTADGTLSSSVISGSQAILAFLPTSSGVTLTAPPITVDAVLVNPTPSVAASGWANIGGATHQAYTPVVGDVGKQLRCAVTGDNSSLGAGGGSATMFTAGTSAVTNTIVAPTTGSPTVSDQTPTQGQIITAQDNSSTWDGTPPLTFTHQWQVSADLSSWSNATGTGNATASYTVALADVGRFLRVNVHGSNSAGGVTIASPATQLVTATVVAPTHGAATLNDTAPTVGDLAGCLVSDSDWDGTKPLTYTYQWQNSVSGTASWSNATGVGNNTNAYTVDATDIGLHLRCAVKGTNSAGSLTVGSPATQAVLPTDSPPVAVTPPVVVTPFNPPAAGETITCPTGTWSGSAPITYQFQWQNSPDGSTWNDAFGVGNDTDTYIVDASDVGLDLQCLVTASNSVGTSSVASNATPAVTGALSASTSIDIFLSTSGPTEGSDSIIIDLSTVTGPPEATDTIFLNLSTTPPPPPPTAPPPGRPRFLRYCGTEVTNIARTLGYVMNGLAGPLWDVAGQVPCSVLFREAGRTTFVDPKTDNAPWYDPTNPASNEFFGLVINDLQVLSAVESRPGTQALGSLGGTILGSRRRSGRQVVGIGSIIAASAGGADFGFQWVKSVLQGNECDDCSVCNAEVRISCPPDDGSDDTVGWWQLFDCGLVDGPKITQTYDFDCAYLTDVEFTIQSEKPYLYKAAEICLDATELVPNGTVGCIDFADWLCGPPGAQLCCPIDPPISGTTCGIVQIEASLGVGGLRVASFAVCDPGPDDVPTSQMVVPYLPPGSTLVLDSSVHTAIFYDADGNASDGTPFLSLPAGQNLGWVEVANCDAASCICVQTLHPCSGGLGTFVTIATMYRED